MVAGEITGTWGLTPVGIPQVDRRKAVQGASLVYVIYKLDT